MFLRYTSWIALAGMSCIGGEHDLDRSKAGTDPSLLRAVERAVYRFEVSAPGHYRAVNPAQRLTLDFDRDEARLKHPQGDAVLRLIGYGYGSRLRAPRTAELKAFDNRIEYQRGWNSASGM